MTRPSLDVPLLDKYTPYVFKNKLFQSFPKSLTYRNFRTKNIYQKAYQTGHFTVNLLELGLLFL